MLISLDTDYEILLTHVWQKSRNFGNEKRTIENKTILDHKKNNFKIGFFARLGNASHI